MTANNKIDGIPADMTPEYRDMAVRLMIRQLFAESATCELFGRAIGLAPTWRDEVQQARFAKEEAEHVAYIADVLEALDVDVDALLERRGAATSFFGLGAGGLDSWTAVIAFNLYGDRAGSHQIRAYLDNSLPAWGAKMRLVLADEAHHQGYGDREAVRVCQDSGTRAEMQAIIDASMPITVKRAFGRLESDENRYCLEVGLKVKGLDTAQVQYNYFKSLQPVMEKAGLRWPAFAAHGVELAPRVAAAFGLN